MNQAVTVKVGATLTGDFISSFRKSDQQVSSLAKNTKLLDKNLNSLLATAKKAPSILGRITASVTKLATGFQTLQMATSRSITTTNRIVGANARVASANSRLMASNRSLSSSYESLRRDHVRLLVQLNRRPRPMAPFMRPPLLPVPPGSGGRGGGGGRRGRDPYLRGSDSVGGSLAGLGAGATALGGGIVYGINAIGREQGAFDYSNLLTLQNADKGPKDLAAFNRQIFDLRRGTGQSAEAFAGGIGTMVANGADLDKVVLPSIKRIGQAATATGSDMTDLGSAVGALSINLKMLPVQVSDAMDIMYRSGKAGRFELKNMAEFFPAVLAAASDAGMGGKTTALRDTNQIASALQVMMTAAGDPSTGANNLANLFQSINKQVTITKFKQRGVDLPGEMTKLKAKGLSSLEAFVTIAKQVSQGNAQILANLVEDVQAGTALRALIRQQSLYRDIRNKNMDKKGNVLARGDIANSFAGMQQSSSYAYAEADASLYELRHTLAVLLTPSIITATTWVQNITSTIRTWTDANPKLASSIAGLVAVGGTLLLVGGALLLAVGGIAAAWAAAVPLFIAGGEAIADAFAAISGPALLIGAGIAGIGLLIWKFWEPLSALFTGFASGLMEGLSPVWEVISPMVKEALEMLQPVFDWLTTQLHLNEGQLKSWTDAGKLAGRLVGGWISTVIAAFGGLFWAASNTMAAVIKVITNVVTYVATFGKAVAFDNVFDGWLDGLKQSWAWVEKIMNGVGWITGHDNSDKNQREAWYNVRSKFGTSIDPKGEINPTAMLGLWKDGKINAKDIKDLRDGNSEFGGSGAYDENKYGRFLDSLYDTASKGSDGGPKVTHNNIFNMTTQPGQSHEEIAKAVVREWQKTQDQRNTENLTARLMHKDTILPIH